MAVFSTLVAAFTAATTWFTSLGVVAQFAIRVAVGIGLNQIALKLAGKETPAPSFGTTTTLQTGADVPVSFLMGKGATSGHLEYVNEWGVSGGTPNAYITQVRSLSDLPVQALTGIWVNGARCTFGETADADKGLPVLEFRDGAADHLWVKFYDGTQTTADAFLTGTVSEDDREWDSTAVGVGAAYVVVTYLVHQTLWPNGHPEFVFEVTGIPLYDPTRDTSVGGSGAQRWADPTTWGGDGDEFPAVQAYNLLRGIRHDGDWMCGIQDLTAPQLPAAHWIAQIAKCRAVIAGDGGDEPTYRASGEIAVGADGFEIAQALLDACNGRLSEAGAAFKVFVGAPDDPVMDFTDDDIVSTAPQSFAPFFGLSETVNGISARYPSPAAGWQTETAPPLLRDDLEAEDGGRRLLADVDLTLVPYAEQVQRLMKAGLEEARRARRHTIQLSPEYWALEPGDVVEWTSARNGYIAKLFRVDGVADLPDCDVILDLTEVDPADYDYDTLTDYVPPAVPGTLAPPIAAQEVKDFAVAPSSILDANGANRRPAILVTWDGDVQAIDALTVQVRVAATNEAVTARRFDDFADGAGLIAEGILPAETYEVRARYVPSRPRVVDWTAWHTVTVGDYRLVPDDLADAVWDAIEQDATDIATDLATSIATSVAQGIVDDFNDGTIVPIRQDLDVREVEQRGADAALAAIGEQIGWLTTRLAGTDSLIRSAGVYTDPDDGTVRIVAAESALDRASDLELRLDAADASIALRVTYGELNTAISNAVLDPTQIPVVDELQVLVNDLRIDLDGLTGTVSTKAATTEVDGIDVRLTTAETEIDSLQAEIVTKVETSTFDDLEARTTTVETSLGAFDGASFSVLLADTRALQTDADLTSAASLQALLDLYMQREAVRRDVAYAASDLRAVVDEDRVATASALSELGAAIDENTALYRLEVQARADGDAASVSLLQALEAETDDALAFVQGQIDTRVTEHDALAATVTSLGVDLADAETDIAGNVTALDALDGRVTTAEGTISAQGTAITGLTAALADAEDDIAAGATAVDALDVRVTSAEGTISAQASAITSLSTTVGGHTTTLTTLGESVDGIEASLTIQINNNGHVSGLVLQSGQGDAGETIGAFAIVADQFHVVGPGGDSESFLDVYTTPTVVEGVTIQPGGYLRQAFIREGSIGNAQVAGVLQSDNYAEDGDGLPTEGVKIDFRNDTIKVAGAVFARPLRIATGSFSTGSPIVVNPALPLYQVASWDLVATGYEVPVDTVWMVSDRTYIVRAAFSGAATADGGITGDNEYWGCKAELQPFARWNGPQQLYLRVEVWAKGIQKLHAAGDDTAPGTIHWSLYEVS